MRYARLTAVAAGPAAVAVGLAGAGPRAEAPGDGNYQGEPLSGDIDGNGVADRATLTKTSPATCDVVVELGLGGGRYGPKTTYSYPEPRNEEFDFGYCPDMGVIVDLGGDGVSELVLAWFDGSPDPENLGDLLVLENFQPVAGFSAIYQPSEIGLAEFNGDGLADVYEWTDQGDGFQSWLNTPGGELVEGPCGPAAAPARPTSRSPTSMATARTTCWSPPTATPARRRGSSSTTRSWCSTTVRPRSCGRTGRAT